MTGASRPASWPPPPPRQRKRQRRRRGSQTTTRQRTLLPAPASSSPLGRVLTILPAIIDRQTQQEPVHRGWIGDRRIQRHMQLVTATPIHCAEANCGAAPANTSTLFAPTARCRPSSRPPDNRAVSIGSAESAPDSRPPAAASGSARPVDAPPGTAPSRISPGRASSPPPGRPAGPSVEPPPCRGTASRRRFHQL